MPERSRSGTYAKKGQVRLGNRLSVDAYLIREFAAYPESVSAMAWTFWKKKTSPELLTATGPAKLIELRNGASWDAPLCIKGLTWSPADRAEVEQCLARKCIVLVYGRVLKSKNGQPQMVSSDTIFLGVFDPLPAGALAGREEGGPTELMGTYEGYLEDVLTPALAGNTESPLRAMEEELGKRLNFGYGRFGFLYANERNIRFAARRLSRHC